MWTKNVFGGLLLACVAAAGCSDDGRSGSEVAGNQSSVIRREASAAGDEPSLEVTRTTSTSSASGPAASAVPSGPVVVGTTRSVANGQGGSRPAGGRGVSRSVGSQLGGTQCATASCDAKIATFYEIYPDCPSEVTSCCLSATTCGITADDSRYCIDPAALGFEPFGRRGFAEGPSIGSVTRVEYFGAEPSGAAGGSIRIERTDGGAP